MDNTTQQDLNGAPQKQAYQTLGKKVFWLFFLQTSPATLIFLIISIILFVLSFQPFFAQTLSSSMQTYYFMATLILFLLFLISAGISFAIAWLNYINYKFLMAEDSFKIKRGILNKTENAIPYRQVQNVDIERPFLFLILGLSRLIILTAGHEDEASEEKDEAEGVIPAVDKKLAEWMQTELLKRADIQKIIQTNGAAGQN